MTGQKYWINPSVIHFIFLDDNANLFHRFPFLTTMHSDKIFFRVSPPFPASSLISTSEGSDEISEVWLFSCTFECTLICPNFPRRAPQILWSEPRSSQMKRNNHICNARARLHFPSDDNTAIRPPNTRSVCVDKVKNTERRTKNTHSAHRQHCARLHWLRTGGMIHCVHT